MSTARALRDCERLLSWNDLHLFRVSKASQSESQSASHSVSQSVSHWQLHSSETDTNRGRVGSDLILVWHPFQSGRPHSTEFERRLSHGSHNNTNYMTIHPSVQKGSGRVFIHHHRNCSIRLSDAPKTLQARVYIYEYFINCRILGIVIIHNNIKVHTP